MGTEESKLLDLESGQRRRHRPQSHWPPFKIENRLLHTQRLPHRRVLPINSLRRRTKENERTRTCPAPADELQPAVQGCSRRPPPLRANSERPPQRRWFGKRHQLSCLMAAALAELSTAGRSPLPRSRMRSAMAKKQTREPLAKSSRTGGDFAGRGLCPVGAAVRHRLVDIWIRPR
jgi:hypothetical protein